MRKVNVQGRFWLWRIKNSSQRRFVLFTSMLVGLLSGLAAVLLKNTAHHLGSFITKAIHGDEYHFLYILIPVVGIFLAVIFVKFIIKDDISHGVSKILLAISRKKSQLKPHNNFSSFIAGALTVGFGGSVGLEAPIVLTGSSIGSTLGRIFRLNYKSTTILVGCGAAGAIAGIFNAPIAGILFALEVLMLDLTVWSIVPLLIASATATIVSYFLMGKDVVFSFTVIENLNLRSIPFYVLLGIVTGFISIFFTRGVMIVEKTMGKLQNIWLKLVIGGLLLGVIIYILPPLFGEGYDTLKDILGGDPHETTMNSIFSVLQDNTPNFILFFVLLLVFKVIATALTNASGGVGGIFAPTLFMGGVSGFLFSHFINIFRVNQLSERNFALVGMAGTMAGVMHAPMTAIFLIAEITGGYKLFVPLIITSIAGYLTSKYFLSYSLYTDRLAKRGELITHHKDKAVLKLMDTKNVIEKDLYTVKPDDSLAKLIKVISRSKRNLFPVVGDNKEFIGIITLDEIRHIMFNPEVYENTFVKDLMFVPRTIIDIEDSMEEVMEKFERTSAWNLPVVDQDKYVGIISKSKVFNAYRELLVQVSDE